jgi:sec-independent protein translocase protein TatA
MFTLNTIVPLIGTPGLMELLLIGGAVLLVFGAAKLPKLGKGLGEGIRNFKTGLKGEESKSTEIKKADGENEDSPETDKEEKE